MDSLSRRIDNLLIEKHQGNKGSRGPTRSTLAGNSNTVRALQGPARLVADALNAELDGDLLLRVVRANRRPGGLVPRPCGKTSIEQVMESGAASKFLSPKVELRRPREKRAERSSLAHAAPTSFPAVPTSTSIAGSSAFTATTSTTSESRSTTPAVPPANVPLKPFDFGLTTTTSGLSSQSRSGGGLRPMNKHQREKNEVKADKVKLDVSAGKGAALAGSVGSNGGTGGGAFS